MPPLPSPGDPVPELQLPPVERGQLVRYAGASGDFNPIHWDADFARESGYNGPIAHGMLSMAFLARALTAWTGATSVLHLEARFKAITYPGDPLTVTGRVTEVSTTSGTVTVDLSVAKADGTVTTAGRATVRWAQPG